MSNENFIENEDGFMFTMMNTKHLNELQKHQVENLKEYWDSKMELKICKKPQAWIKKIANQQVYQMIKRFLNILKHLTIPFFPHYPHQACQHHIPHKVEDCSQTNFSNQNSIATDNCVKKFVEFFK